jgi:hypothetical protein
MIKKNHSHTTRGSILFYKKMRDNQLNEKDRVITVRELYKLYIRILFNSLNF